MPLYRCRITIPAELETPAASYEIQVRSSAATAAELAASRWFIDRRDRKHPEDSMVTVEVTEIEEVQP